MYVPMHLYIYVCMYLSVDLCIYVCMYMSMCLCIYLCIFVCMYVYLTNCNASWPSGTRAKLALLSFNIPGVVSKTIEVYGSGILL